MQALRGPIEAGVPIVVLEPSCASVFRDELRGLFPRDALAQRLREQVFLLSEFLGAARAGLSPAAACHAACCFTGTAITSAVMKWSDEESLLRKMGAEVECPDSGCCGMAGPFGFDKDKYDVSQAVGERVLLAGRAASPTGNADRLRRLQLPRADSSGHRPAGDSSGRGDSPGGEPERVT